jgi:hypothetical protein
MVQEGEGRLTAQAQRLVPNGTTGLARGFLWNLQRYSIIQGTGPMYDEDLLQPTTSLWNKAVSQ